MPIIKLFLPINSYYDTKCDAYRVLLGDVIKNENNDNISIYVLSVETESHRNALKPIGLYKTRELESSAIDHDTIVTKYIALLKNSTATQSNCSILIDRSAIIPLVGNKDISLFHVQIMLYDLAGFESLSKSYQDEMTLPTSGRLDDEGNSLMCLTRLLQLNKSKDTSRGKRNIFTSQMHTTFQSVYTLTFMRLMQSFQLNKTNDTSRTRSIFLTPIYSIFQSIYTLIFMRLAAVIRPVFGESAIYRHFSMWSDCIRCYSFQSGKAWTIALDVVAGMILMISLLHMVDPGQHLIEFTEIMVNYLRQLLTSLKGSPVGFKLNIELNHFFLDCFSYHVDLWGIFLEMISPVIKYFFMPLMVLGCFGISFQLAILSDLLMLTTLHATCFYIYAAVLYHTQIVGLLALWRVVVGRRKNILKGRVESYDYSNSQLYLSTIIFTGLLFLLPTVLIYYVVFASLRFCLFCITYALMVIRQKILVLPVYCISRWIFGCHIKPNVIEISVCDVLHHQSGLENAQQSVPIFYIKPAKCSFPSWIDDPTLFRRENIHPNGDSMNTPTSRRSLNIKQFFIALLKSEIMGFRQPK